MQDVIINLIKEPIMDITNLNTKAKWLLIAVMLGVISTWIISFMLDDQVAMRQCMAHHGYNTCHYQLMR
jgi:hypothetical protein